MSARATVFQKLQLGAEVTPGTLVTAAKRLLSVGLNPNPQLPTDAFRPIGSKFATTSTQQKEWSAGQWEGTPDYNAMAYIFSSVLKKVTSGGAGSGSSAWSFTPDTFGPDTIQTYSMDSGSAAGAERLGFVAFTGFELRLTPRSVSIRGDMIGRAMAYGITPASATDVVPIPMPPKGISVFVGDSIGGLTRLTKCLEVAVNMRGRFNPLMTLNELDTSFTDLVEAAPTFDASLTVEANSVAAGYMTDLRASKQKFLQIVSNGPLLEVGLPANLTLTIPFMFKPPAMGDNQGVYGGRFDLIPDHESVFGGAITALLTNSVGAL